MAKIKDKGTHRVQTLMKFFSEKTWPEDMRVKDNPPMRGDITQLSSEEIHKILNLFRDHWDLMDGLKSYSKRFKQATQEMTVEDIWEAQRLMTVKEVLES